MLEWKVYVSDFNGKEINEYNVCDQLRCLDDCTKNARKNGFGVLIGAAGMAAHLAGALAARTTLPVIGIPVTGKRFDGMDALLSTVQMPTGIPVATVAVNGAANAALLAAEILAVSDGELAAKLDEKRRQDAEKVLEKDRKLNS